MGVVVLLRQLAHLQLALKAHLDNGQRLHKGLRHNLTDVLACIAAAQPYLHCLAISESLALFVGPFMKTFVVILVQFLPATQQLGLAYAALNILAGPIGAVQCPVLLKFACTPCKS